MQRLTVSNSSGDKPEKERVHAGFERKRRDLRDIVRKRERSGNR